MFLPIGGRNINVSLGSLTYILIGLKLLVK